MSAPATRQHFLTLDFLRGTAAFCVLLLHWFDGVGLPWCHYGYLAVDFFFLLSGFVIAHSYEHRLLTTMSARRFLWIRVVRLYPLIVVGVGLGLVRAILRGYFAPAIAVAPLDYILLTLANLVMVPLPRASIIGAGLFPLDSVLWSLLFELFAYFAYAVFVRRLTCRVLAIIVAIGAAGLIALLVSGIGIEGSLNAGGEQPTFAGGFARIIFGFFFGVLVYRAWSTGRLPSLAAGPLLLSAVLTMVLCLPKGWLEPWAEMPVVALMFPAIVVLGANHTPKGLAAHASRVLGDLSYPVYVLQMSVMWIGSGTLKVAHLYDRLPLIWVGTALLATVAAVSWAALIFVDQPVRRYLTRLTYKSP